jgi:hypothetical protein
MKKMAKTKKMKKSYSTGEIREAIAYWKGRLASLNEADEAPEGDVENDEDDFEDDSKGGSSSGINLPDEDKVEDKAKSTPVGVFNPLKRYFRMHLHAEKVVIEKLGKLLNKSKMGTGEAVVIENSAIDEAEGTFDMDADEIVVTVRV